MGKQELLELRKKSLVAPADLMNMLQSDSPPSILAVQSVCPYTGKDSQCGRWIPGAVDAEAYTDFAAKATATSGDRPLPDIDNLQRAARSWGLTHNRTVVLYDSDRSLTAARGWWVLKWAGLSDVRVLDGGLSGWLAENLPVSRERASATCSSIDLAPGNLPEFGADQARYFVREGVLLDSRIRPNYIGGARTGGDPKRGHIPGAVSAPTLDNVTDYGYFADSATLGELYLGYGIDGKRPVGVYCGAGMSAAHTVLALASIGIHASMYPGSWSQWVSDPRRPVRRGAIP
ncbi:MAG: rhodanese-like domain-containing protein [Albidovulum sp.]|nr:rhodanese-like domain-containing protein [Albidovulum sp.]